MKDVLMVNYLRSRLEAIKVEMSGIYSSLGEVNPTLTSKEVKGLCVANGVDNLTELKRLAMQTYRENVPDSR